MRGLTAAALTAVLVATAAAPTAAADDAKVKAATRRVERGGKMIGAGKVARASARRPGRR